MRIQIVSAIIFLAVQTAVSGVRVQNSENGKIAGGTEGTYGDFPYMISLQDGSSFYFQHFCGGVIYDENYIITSAYCALRINTTISISYIQVLAGEHTLFVEEEYEQPREVDTVIVHSDYNSNNYYDDIALIRVTSPFLFNTTAVQPIALPAAGDDTQGFCSVMGWGQTFEGGPAPSVIRQATLPYVTDTDCRTDYNGDNNIADEMMCAGSDGKGICTGDFGGPLVCQNANGAYLGGISSWVYGCGRTGYPSVFTQISAYIDWITDNAV